MSKPGLGSALGNGPFVFSPLKSRDVQARHVQARHDHEMASTGQVQLHDELRYGSELLKCSIREWEGKHSVREESLKVKCVHP